MAGGTAYDFWASTTPSALGTGTASSSTYLRGDGSWALQTGNVVTMAYGGTLAVMVGTLRYYVEGAFTIATVRASVGTAPTGAAVICDVNKNGTTIYTTQANRPTIAISGFTANANSPNVTTLVAGDYLTVDIDQIGSTIAGADLTVQIVLVRT